MKHFKNGDRVLVKAYGIYEPNPIDPPAIGTVCRLRKADEGAWINLDDRRGDIEYPFPADDECGRANHVIAYPEDCDVMQTVSK